MFSCKKSTIFIFCLVCYTEKTVGRLSGFRRRRDDRSLVLVTFGPGHWHGQRVRTVRCPGPVCLCASLSRLFPWISLCVRHRRVSCHLWNSRTGSSRLVLFMPRIFDPRPDWWKVKSCLSVCMCVRRFSCVCVLWKVGHLLLCHAQIIITA